MKSRSYAARQKICNYIRPNFYQTSSHTIALAFQSVCSRSIADRLYYDRIALKIWTGRQIPTMAAAAAAAAAVVVVVVVVVRLYVVRQTYSFSFYNRAGGQPGSAGRPTTLAFPFRLSTS